MKFFTRTTLAAVLAVFPLALTTGGRAHGETHKTGASESAIKNVNSQVARLAARIQKKELPYLEVANQGGEPTEGVPPSFKFFFDPKDESLQACEVWVGHETWGSRFSYYFGPDGKPLKYLETISDRPDHPEPKAILYDADGSVLWKNMQDPRLKTEDISSLYRLLRSRLEPFEHY